MWPFTSNRGAGLPNLPTPTTPATATSLTPSPQPPPRPSHTPTRSRRVSEDFFDFSTPSLGDFTNPFLTQMPGFSALFPLFPIRRLSDGFSSYLYMTAGQLDLMRWFGRLSYELNQYSQAALTQLANYTIGSGYSYSCVPAEGETASPSLLKACDRFLRKFREKNEWEDLELERHCYIETRRDGDLFLRLRFDDESGIPRLSKHLGEEVRDEKFNTPEWSFGCLVIPPDLTLVKKWQLWKRNLDYGQNSSTEVLDGYEVIRFLNHLAPENKRGLTDFFNVRDVLDETQKLLRSGRIGETARQAISYVMQMDGSNQGEVQGQVSANSNTVTDVFNTGSPPQYMPTSTITPGEVHSIPEGMTYEEGPTGDAIPIEIIVKASLRACAAKWNIPMSLLDGEIDSNFAAALVEEGPLVKRIQVDQNTSKRRYTKVMKRALLFASKWGYPGIPPDVLERVDVQADCPPIIPRDAEGETNRNELLVRNRVMSRRTWAKREDLDFEAECEQIKAEDELGISLEVMGSENDPGETSGEDKTKSQTAGANYQRQADRSKL